MYHATVPTRRATACRASLASILASLLLAVAARALPAQALAAQQGWPREIPSGVGAILIYSPQVDAFAMDLLTARAAVSLARDTSVEPVFGALWFTSRVVTNRDADTVAYTQIHVLKLRVPGLRGSDEQAFTAAIERAANEWQLGESLARFTYAVEAARQASVSAAQLDNTPPRVVFARGPAVLLAYDGAPQVRSIEGTDLERVINTPYVVIYDPKAKTYYLTGGRHWYSARAALGPWSSLAAAPPKVVAVAPLDTAAAAADSGPPRAIVTATEPTELVVITGEPMLVPITSTDLLYVSNTESDLFKELQSQDYFLLLSGRWFRSRTLAGPWSYVPPGKLPATFAKIPPDTPRSDVLASVPGTEAANDAIVDAAIPQTAAVKRAEAALDVTYDGDPRFEPVEGTAMAYAVNASTAVLRIDGRYYACDQAVWFVSSSPTGPWTVSDTLPPAVQTIPPTSPVYYVKFVQVYYATPDVVYVGYTPGYLGAYPYYGTIVYGTGWHYRPYIGRRYYFPRPWTWGLCARYRRWRGWGFGVSYNWGFLIVGVAWGGGYRPHHRPPGWYGGGWYGPGGFRPPAPHRPPRRPAAPPVYRPRTVTNIYARPERRGVVIPRPPVREPSRPTTRVRENNVFVTPDGEVRRRTAEGWETRTENQWRPTTPPPAVRPTQPPAARPAQPPAARPAQPPAARPAQPAPKARDDERERLERDYRARTRPSPEQTTRPSPAPRTAPAPSPKERRTR